MGDAASTIPENQWATLKSHPYVVWEGRNQSASHPPDPQAGGQSQVAASMNM